MAESKVHRLRIKKKVVHTNTLGTTGRFHYTFSGGDIPAGYRVASTAWRVDEDGTSNVFLSGTGDPVIDNSAAGGPWVTFYYNVNALPAQINFEVVAERSDEPDVAVDLGIEVNDN